MNNELTTPTVPKKTSTLAGNYFISNYPPFSFWSDDQKVEMEVALNSEPVPGTKLGLYHHIPFCRKRCHFCYFRVYTDKNAREIQTYLDATIAELKVIAERPLYAGRKPHFVYFGGGTPSYLSAKQLKEVTDQLKAVLPWDAAEEVAFEAEPGTLNPGKLAAIKEVGVTRLSLGIENFDDHILEINGRAHRSGEVFTAFERARAEKFDQVNIDQLLPNAQTHNVGVIAKRPIANAAWKDLKDQQGMYQSYAKVYTERLAKINLNPGDLGFNGPPEQAWPELALRFTLSQPGVSTAIIGTTSRDNARANLKYASAEPLNETQIATIRNAFKTANTDGTWIGQT